MSDDPARPTTRRKRRGLVIALFSLVVLLAVLLIADRAGKAIAENDFASQAEKSGMGARPSVDITGFPFLTQLAARDFTKVNISAGNVPAGPLQISRINATATGSSTRWAAFLSQCRNFPPACRSRACPSLLRVW